jgi:hypothetical protein
MSGDESEDRMNRGPCLRAFAFALFLCLPSLAAAQPPQPVGAGETLQYNPYTRKREFAPEGAMPQYNPYTRQRELAGPGETLQYNPYTRKREYAPKGAMPRYNPYTKRRELVGPP